MVTLLIEDVRSGETDFQLAEIRVPLRPAGREENGFWADAKDVAEALQSSPSRIDGLSFTLVSSVSPIKCLIINRTCKSLHPSVQISPILSTGLSR